MTIQFNIFADLDEGAKCTLSKSVGNTRLGKWLVPCMASTGIQASAGLKHELPKAS